MLISLTDCYVTTHVSISLCMSNTCRLRNLWDVEGDALWSSRALIKLTNQIMCPDWSELPAGWGRTCNEAGSKQEEQLLCLTHSFTQGPGGSRYPLDTGQRCLLRLLEAHHLSVNTESSPIMPFNSITWCDKTLTASCSSPSILLSSPLLCTPHFLPVLANKQLLQQYTF